MRMRLPNKAIHQALFSRIVCQTSHPPPTSARPAAKKRHSEANIRPTVHSVDDEEEEEIEVVVVVVEVSISSSLIIEVLKQSIKGDGEISWHNCQRIPSMHLN